MRIINAQIRTMEEINLPIKYIKPMARYQNGLILITGAVGSGKSTTMSAIMDFINKDRDGHILTMEDPIEFVFDPIGCHVTQREVHLHTESFPRALRGALRQDPDIILVGEMRDKRTIQIVLKAAETGHLVLSTLHTLDAPRSIERILSVFNSSEQKILKDRLAESIKAVISQRLLRRSDRDGRIAVFEIMRATLSIQECIKDANQVTSIKDLIASSRDQYGMQTFDQHLMDLYKDGIINLPTAQSAASSSADFERDVHFGN